MKKLILLAVLAMTASVTQAVSFSWKIQSSAQVKFNGSSVGTSATAYLVYLGSDTAEAANFKDFIDLSPVAPETKTSMGKVNKSVTVTSDGAGNYGLFLTYTSGEDTYYNVSSTTVNLSEAALTGLFDDGTALNPATFAFSDTTNALVSSWDAASIGKGWYAVKPVPEPATGALALAGIALLFRRRKA